MAVRVVGGKARGRALKVARGSEIRPSSGRVRSALFSILAPYLAGASVLDLYAGTGALGIEALSRGAERADFVEWQDRQCADLRANLEALGYAPQARVHTLPVAQALSLLSERYDLVLMDPPYAQEGLVRLLEQVVKVVREGGVVVVEHDRRQVLPPAVGGLERLTERVYGDTALSIYRREG